MASRLGIERIAGEALVADTWKRCEGTPAPGAPAPGELRFASGDIYVGALIDGVPSTAADANATLRYGDGARYEGAFRGGLAHGRGVLETRAALYSGAFERGEMCGAGALLEERLALSTPGDAALEGTYFATPRLVHVTVLSVGTFARNALSSGARLESTRLVASLHEGAPRAAPASATLRALRPSLSQELAALRTQLEFDAATPGIEARLREERAGDGTEVRRVLERGTWLRAPAPAPAPTQTAAQLNGVDGARRVETCWLDAAAAHCSARVATYEGAFVAHQFHGTGMLESRVLAADGTLAEHDVYRGDFERGALHGRGTLTTLRGSTYVGEFRADVRHGHGTTTRADGTRVVGRRTDGAKDGTFEYQLLNGDRLTYEFTRGTRSLVFAASATNTRSRLYYALPRAAQRLVARLPTPATPALVDSAAVQLSNAAHRARFELAAAATAVVSCAPRRSRAAVAADDDAAQLPPAPSTLVIMN
jgi:hypothetical protein